MKKFYAIMVAFILLPVWTLYPVPVSAAQEEAIEMTIDDAISRAMRYSKTMESVQLSTDLADENREEAAMNISPSWITSGEGKGSEAAYASLLNADLSYETAKVNEEIQADVLAVSIRSSYYGILQYIGNIQCIEAELFLQEKNYAFLQAQYKAGRCSRIELQQAESQLRAKESELTNARNTLNNAYISFNQQIGLKEEERPVLTEYPLFEAMNDIEDLDAEIRSLIANNPEQLQQKEALELKERLSDASDQDEIELRQVEIAMEQSEDNLVQQLYSAYYNIQHLEQQYELLLADKGLAETQLRLAKINYQVGRGTQLDVLSAQADVLQAEQNLLKLVCQHDLLKRQFSMPWTM